MRDFYSTAIGLAIPPPCTETDLDRALHEPELRLMLAILEDAIVTFERGLGACTAEQRKLCVEVRRWVSSRNTDSPVSFENVCALLLLDPDYIRAGLRALERRQRGEVPRLQRRIRRSGKDCGPRGARASHR